VRIRKSAGRVGYGRLHGMWRSLVSAPALGAGGRRFESGHPDKPGKLSYRSRAVFATVGRGADIVVIYALAVHGREMSYS
jgi:hypothetical protein